MKRVIATVSIVLLISGCAGFPGGHGAATTAATGSHTATSGMTERGDVDTSPDESGAGGAMSPPVQAGVHERNVNIGNWRVDCLYEETRFQTQCKAETYGKVLQFIGDEVYEPTPVLWISWMSKEDPDKRTVCMLGHDYPVNAVSFRVDNHAPLQLAAGTASGCFIASQTFINQIRKGSQLVVSFLRFPWGETKVGFDLHRSNRALDELKKLVASQ
jgi:hypothetical protein